MTGEGLGTGAFPKDTSILDPLVGASFNSLISASLNSILMPCDFCSEVRPLDASGAPMSWMTPLPEVSATVDAMVGIYCYNLDNLEYPAFIGLLPSTDKLERLLGPSRRVAWVREVCGVCPTSRAIIRIAI